MTNATASTEPSECTLESALAEIDRLRGAERRKDEFLGQLAHEVGNVLVPLPLALEILKQPGLTRNTIDRVREILGEQAVYVQRLVGQLRNVSRLTRGIELDRRKVELHRVVERAAAAVRPLVDQAQHELVITLPDHPVELEADAERLEQALVHLLDNAARYTRPGGRIQLEAVEGQDRELVLRVSDNGSGIDAELLPRIFEPFIRREGAIDWGAGRLGIGLSLVRQCAEVHGGSVSAESGGPEQGSAFTVRLPLG
ncbi:MAG TPA: HAMP domain-containing sensor histidine kinase [Planctomycetaceae bacterium]|nr:HAMP domain-containing sensor histidine kinase [Planctomycetaceae bacterium]